MEWDWIIATYYTNILSLWECGDLRAKLFHLCQGYEGGWPEAAQQLPLIERAYRLPIPRLIISRELKLRLKRRFPGRYFVIGQGVEHHHFYPASSVREKDGRPIPRRIFLIGLFPASVKNISTALSALKKVRDEMNLSFELVRITTCDTRYDEEKIIGTIPHYHIQVAPAEVGDLLRRGGIMLCPNRPGEGFGLPAVEAMACGVPVVLSAIPSHLALDHRHDYALFVDPDDVEGMARAVARLLTDFNLQQRLIRRGIEVARRFRFSRVARRIEWWLRIEGIRRHLERLWKA